MNEAEKRKRIVETALEKFRRFGVRRVTVDEVARDLRMSKKTLYKHFESKEALVVACMDQILSVLIPGVEKILDSTMSPGHKLLHLWETIAVLPRLVSSELISDLKANYPHIWEAIDDGRHGVFNRLEKLIEDGIESGEIDPRIHPRVFGRIILAILDNVLVPEVFALGEFSPGQALQTLVTIFSSGLLIDKAPPANEEYTR